MRCDSHLGLSTQNRGHNSNEYVFDETDLCFYDILYGARLPTTVRNKSKRVKRKKQDSDSEDYPLSHAPFLRKRPNTDDSDKGNGPSAGMIIC